MRSLLPATRFPRVYCATPKDAHTKINQLLYVETLHSRNVVPFQPMPDQCGSKLSERVLQQALIAVLLRKIGEDPRFTQHIETTFTAFAKDKPSVLVGDLFQLAIDIHDGVWILQLRSASDPV